VLTVSVLGAFLTGALAVQMQADLGFGDRRLGLAVALYFGLSATLAPLGGRLADRLGWRPAGVLGATLSAVCLLGVALVASTYLHLLAFLVMGGISNAISSPASNLLLVSETRPEHHGFTFGIKQAAIPLATMAAGASVPIIALTVGWRWAFAAATLLAVATIGAMALRGTGRRRRRGGGRATSAAVERLTARDRRLLTGIAVATGLGTLTSGALSTFTVRSLVEGGLTAGRAGALVGAAGVAGLLVRVGGGYLADRRGWGGLVPSAVLLGVGALGTAMIATGRMFLVVPGTVIAFGGSWGWQGLNLVGIVQVFRRSAGAATGLLQLGTAGGHAAGPLAFGLVATQLGFGAAWSIYTVLALLGATLVLRSASSLRARETSANRTCAADPC
jgi:predicted MFS family arabinose efflux permease